MSRTTKGTEAKRDKPDKKPKPIRSRGRRRTRMMTQAKPSRSVR